jgi:L-2-hydroxyglutarate oxidase LhgO
MAFDFDATVVGAGAVGLAVGRALTRRGLTVLVLESKPHIGEGVSSRNSEVIHAGFQYPTGSLKAKFCVEGRRMLYVYLDERGVAYKRCGKLVVATEESDIPKLEALLDQGRLNGVEGMEAITGAQAMALEPGLKAVVALTSPQSGLFASHDYMLNLQGEIEAGGGAVVLSTPFEGAVSMKGGGFTVRSGGQEPTTLTCRLLVTAPGLSAQAVAARIEGFPPERIPVRHLGKGIYFRLTSKAPFERLIYPVPEPGGLGTHLTLDLAGHARFGPDVEWIDHVDYTVDPDRRAGFEAAVRKIWPGVDVSRLVPGYAGVRPKVSGPGEPAADFVISGPRDHGLPGLVNLFGIESPGLTASLAIADCVAGMVGE